MNYLLPLALVVGLLLLISIILLVVNRMKSKKDKKDVPTGVATTPAAGVATTPAAVVATTPAGVVTTPSPSK